MSFFTKRNSPCAYKSRILFPRIVNKIRLNSKKPLITSKTNVNKNNSNFTLRISCFSVASACSLFELRPFRQTCTYFIRVYPSFKSPSTMSSKTELACVYAALILVDDDITVTGEKINTVLKAASVDVEPYWPGLFAKALEGVNVKELISNVGSGAGAGPAVAAAPVEAAAAPAAAAKEDKKKKEESDEGSDDDMGFGLFD